MSLFTRARRHVDMDRVKELREEKIKEETIAEVLKQQEDILAELKKIEIKESPKYSNWRRELTEQMTTVDMGMVNLPGMGDVNLADFDFPVTALGSSPGYVQSGNDYTFGPASAGVPPAETASLNIKMNSEKYDTIVFDFVAGTIDHKLLVFTGSDGGSNVYELSNTTGRKELRLLPSDRKKSVSIAFNIGRDLGGGLGTNKMLNMSFRRVAPMNLVVGLDDPEATSFVRDGQSDALSPNQKKKKIEDQLKAGSDYLDKMFGTNVMPKGATTIADYEPQQSFSDIAQGLPYTDEDDAFDDPYYKGPPPDLDDDSDFDPDDFEYAGAPKMPDYVKDSIKRQYKGGPDYSIEDKKNIINWQKKMKAKNPTTQVAHYEPQGEVISEKKRLKSLKDLVDKIPGYYDGKPSPLGFPVEEPPKMKNGFHPDLVDGKKVAKRFNRLDPISAKAMPPTGNPHIDKKVRAAAKKPK